MYYINLETWNFEACMSFAVLPNPMKKKYAKMLTAPSKMNVGMYGQIQRFR